MQSFNELRKYIIDNLNIAGVNFTAKDDKKRTYTSVYLVEKPETHILTSGNGLIIKWNESRGGQTVRLFTVEIRILSKEIADLIQIKDELVNMLDFYNRPCAITEYKKFVLSNESGIYFDDNNDSYIDKLFFECRLI